MRVSELTNPAFYADPYPVYERLRAEGPLIPVMSGMWVTGSNAVTEKLLRDKRWGKDFIEYVRMRYGNEHVNDICFQSMNRAVIMANPPKHPFLKGLLMKVFNADQVARFRGDVQKIADSLVDSFIDKRSIDLVTRFANPLPITAICMLMGLAEDETAFFIDQGPEMIMSYSRTVDMAAMTPEQISAANTATKYLQEFFAGKLRERRKSPGNDLISLLLTAEEKGQHLTDEEIIDTIILTFVGGHETSVHMIGNSLIALGRHPEEWEQVRRDESLIPQCVSECLRYDSSLPLTSRHALEDMEFEGINFSEGETVVIFLGSVNRDPMRFALPDRFMIDRPVDPACRHLTFGAGAHYCIGAMLAVVELEIALGTLFRRLPGLRLTNLDSLHWYPISIVRGVKSLQAVW